MGVLLILYMRHGACLFVVMMFIIYYMFDRWDMKPNIFLIIMACGVTHGFCCIWFIAYVCVYVIAMLPPTWEHWVHRHLESQSKWPRPK